MGAKCSSHKRLSDAHAPLDLVAAKAEEQDAVSKLPVQTSGLVDGMPVGYKARRRHSVSAEVASLALGQPVQLRKVEKDAAAKGRIQAAMQHSFLFAELDDTQQADVNETMFRRAVKQGEVIIREGEDGDNFWMIESGTYKAVKQASQGGERLLFTYEGKGAFGELALMYNCPRAATVVAESEGVLWGLDRVTFRNIILVSTMQKRQHYEETLAGMSLLGDMTAEQRAVIADCLSAEVFQDGEAILRQGEGLTSTSKFYLVESGTVQCWKDFSGTRKLVKTIEAGGFFGEVALVKRIDSRAADCIARGRVKALSMGRDAFERLMGPTEQILSKHLEEYEHINAAASSSERSAAEVV